MTRLRRRLIIGIHRWLGLISALFLAVLAVTGLALNHTEKLGLDRIRLENSYILKRYGMASPGEVIAFRIDGNNTLEVCRDNLFINQQSLGITGMPIGAWIGNTLMAVATEDYVILLDREGAFVEKLDATRLPSTPLKGIGKNHSGNAVLISPTGQWLVDPDWLEFDLWTGESPVVNSLEPMALDNPVRRAVLEQLQGEGIPLYRLILDLHSGRLFGLPGRNIMDLTAVAILILISSGLHAFIRGRRP